MGSLNKVSLIGHLGKDPEIRSLSSGDRVCNFNLATSESWKDRNSGERKEKTEWHRIVIFNDNLVKLAESYLRKGSQVYIEGKLQTRMWEKDGVKHYQTEVVLQNFGGTISLLDKKNDREGGGDRGGYGGGYSDGAGSGAQDQRGNPREDFSADLDDEIPF